ncbi:ankyrin repeat protein [Megavirus chiliensis]|uniref:Ankyrin repeat protein n=2 Tax=Megamimivirinae TaxID=3044648 RepID=A0A2L2DLX2_MIMIV|nr:putative ankyrin repeat protein [Megavirus chiliensis]AEQ32491.1 ankyrin repeat protein [Megavirus chiliensis]AVG47154.1 ankyrin repeat protein [Acanthamoeba polyphaga mimivirus]
MSQKYFDNTIKWMFEKVFDQLTLNCQELYQSPYHLIEKRIYNHEIYNLISSCLKINIAEIESYLTDSTFIKSFLFTKIKKRLYVEILLNNLDQIIELVNSGYNIDEISIRLTIINNRYDILKFLVSNKKLHLTQDLLAICAEYSYTDIYFYLKQHKLMPSIYTFNKAVLGNSLSIVQDISQRIGISKKTLETAFETNNTEIILFLINQAEQEDVVISKNFAAYAIVNANFQLLNILIEKNLINWNIELYYSALLSGNLDMIKFVDNHIEINHMERVLDSSKTKRGVSSLLVTDMIYTVNGKKYFSHIMNYSIQSKNLEVVKLSHQQGYGITVSNFITAIQQSTPEILEYLCQIYNSSLPFYLIHYLGLNSKISNKIIKANILIKSKLFKLDTSNLNTIDYQKEAVHIEMITTNTQLSLETLTDPDYIFNYPIFFVTKKGYKLNRKLITIAYLYLKLDQNNDLIKLYSDNYNEIDKQYLVDCLYLFGNMIQIKKLHNMIPITPSQQILMEITCQQQISKLYYLYANNYLSTFLIKNLYNIVFSLNNSHLNTLFNKFGNFKPEFKYIVMSGNVSQIIEWLDKYHEILIDTNDKIINKNIIKNMLLLDNDMILNYLSTKSKYKNLLIHWKLELIDWTREQDLLNVTNILQHL